MSYWLRLVDPVGLILTAVTALAWMVGGWLLVRSLFRLLPGARLISGFTSGWVIDLVLVNLITRWIGLPAASIVSAALILGVGVMAAGKSLRQKETWADWKEWTQPVGALLLAVLFSLAQRGVSIFDDYLHLPLVSSMATGDIPPHFYLNPDQWFAYHYGLQIWAAMLVRTAGLTPWSAWDISKGVAIALTLVNAWLWVRQRTSSRTAAWLGALVIVFGGGARWLLLLLPSSVLTWISPAINLINTGADTSQSLVQALGGPWIMEGGGPVPFPFAFHSGFFVPVFFVLGSTGALPFLTIFLLMSLKPQQPGSMRAAVVLGILSASLALSAEHLFAFLWAGTLLAVGLSWFSHRRWKKQIDAGQWLSALLALGLAAILAIFQGGFITETLRGLAGRWLGISQWVQATNNAYSFSFRWPPAIYSAHLGLLSLGNPRHWLVILAEMGPTLFLAPMVTGWALGLLKRERWLEAGLGFSALACMIFPLFFQYGVDRSITRMPGTALWLWLTLAFPLLWKYSRTSGPVRRTFYGVGYFVIIFGGAILFAVQLISMPTPQAAYFIDSLDTRFSSQFWNQLEPDAQVLDDIPYRAVTVFGRETTAHLSIYEPLPQWEALIQAPRVEEVAAAGYGYIYMDAEWWNLLSQEVRQTFQQPCVREISHRVQPNGKDFRILYDVSGCK
ncbi:hypothetical protein LARV_01700 [Longilinea arvoryzae]|uniref:Glycosyltransferase RgtA/B/C/D-like domain-containing protein n=1 Tax=Longilinea arvoryzae TaxID=360412 RepID=A0A0S7BJG4_9CHLR|nr:hypothetical protein [Longilinea arvoryzae]GAP13941.1 hypothetical protein LARV_01700 [Longilinea arvoryzae]